MGGRIKVLRLLLDSVPLELDPRVGVDQASQRISQLIFNGLFKKTYDFRVEKDLIEDYKVSVDGKRIEIELKKGVLFHDGKELSADDVVYTYLSILNGDVLSLKRGAFALVKRVYKVSKYRVVFLLKDKDSSIFSNMVLGIVKKGKRYVGTGPFVLKKFEGNVIYLKGNRNYFRGSVEFDIKVEIVKDSLTRVLKIKNGEIDLALNMIEPIFLDGLKGSKDIVVENFSGNTVFYLGLNLRKGILRSLSLRRALSYSINYDELNRFIFRGMARRAYGLLPPEHWAYRNVKAKFYYSPDKARKIIRKNGFYGKEIELKCASKETSVRLAMAVRKYFEDVGLKVKLRVMEFPSFYRDIVRGNFEVYPLAWVGISNPDIYYYSLHSKMVPPKGANRGGYRNGKVDELLDMAKREYDEGRLKEIYGEIQEIIAKDVPFIPLFFRDNVLVRKRWLNVGRVYPSGEYYFLFKVGR